MNKHDFALRLSRYISRKFNLDHVCLVKVETVGESWQSDGYQEFVFRAKLEDKYDYYRGVPFKVIYSFRIYNWWIRDNFSPAGILLWSSKKKNWHHNFSADFYVCMNDPNKRMHVGEFDMHDKENSRNFIDQKVTHLQCFLRSCY